MKANELEEDTASFLQFIQDYIRDKGVFLREFTSINEKDEEGIPEITERLQQAARKYYNLS
jgi:hypothetical protein